MQETKIDSVLEESIMKTLVYYDLFSYPLKSNEVFRFLRSNSVTEQDVADCLAQLTRRQIIGRYGDFYTLQKNEHDVHRRLKGNREAESMLPKAREKAILISKFPFVKAVFASGSLSKGYMDENSDLDFFVVTEPNRLWITRTLLALYKRIFLKNSHKHFCVNYFIDSDHLEIEEKNIFTATELATVMPLWGSEYYHRLQQANIHWLLSFFPNYTPREVNFNETRAIDLRRRIGEAIINLFLASWVDLFLMKVAAWRWKKLYQKKYLSHDFAIAFKTKRYVSKNHPRNFQKRVTDNYTERLHAALQELALRK